MLLSGWVAEPANAWSCVACCLVGFAILRLAHVERAPNLRPAGYTAIAIGVCSFVYHARATLATELLDLFSMYLFSTHALAVTAQG